MNDGSKCTEGPRLLPHGTVGALELDGHSGCEWRAWWAYAQLALAIMPEDIDAARSSCVPIGECTADDAIGTSIALDGAT